MAAKLPVDYNTEVFKVDWGSDTDPGVKGFAHTPHGDRVIRARRIVVALPLACLQHADVEFVPDLPPNKKKAILELGSGNVFKIVLQFEHAFWPEDLQLLFTPFSIQLWWPGPK